MKPREAANEMGVNVLSTWMLRLGYSVGAFPMTLDDGRVEWFRPEMRALLPIGGIHVSRSLRRLIRSRALEIRFDSAFPDVMRGCLRPGKDWISEDFIRVYSEAHREGWGHCCECWQGGALVGGVYGLALGKAFCAESMFHRVSNASKVALWALVERCRELGFSFVDAQIMNPHLRSLGAVEVSDIQFDSMLRTAVRQSTVWGPAFDALTSRE